MPDILRPAAWDEYIGQEKLKSELDIRIRAARVAQRALDPILLAAPPGAGKTALATIVAERLGVPLEVLLMPVTEKVFHRLLMEFEGVVLLDEIHRLTPKQMEPLLPLLEFGYMVNNNGRKIEAGELSILGATTEEQKIIEPLHDRFYVPAFDEYDDEDMTLIVISMAHKAGLDTLDEDTAVMFARGAAGVPRRARQFILAYKDLELATGEKPTGTAVMTMLRTTADGLSVNHMRYLNTIDVLSSGSGRDGVGLKIIASLMQLNESVVTNLERMLIRQGYVTLGSTGRELTRKGLTRVRANNEDEDGSTRAAA